MFIAVGDLHLSDSVGKGGLSKLIEDADKFVADLVIDQPMRHAVKSGIKDLVFLGDICEGTRLSYSGQLALARIFRAAKKKGITCWLYLGNHDLFDTDPTIGHSLEVVQLWGFDNVKIITEPTDVEIGGVECRVLPWPHQTFSKSRLNLAHIDVQGSKTDSGRLNDKEELNKSEAWALIGHIHTSQRVRNSVYPGTLYQTNFGEKPEKFFSVVRHDDGFDIELIPVRNVYTLHSVKVESKSDLKDLPSGDQHLYKMVIENPKVSPADWAHLKVVKVTTSKSEAEELAIAKHWEKLTKGASIQISPDEFFEAWLESQPRPDAFKEQVRQVRKRVLAGVAK